MPQVVHDKQCTYCLIYQQSCIITYLRSTLEVSMLVTLAFAGGPVGAGGGAGLGGVMGPGCAVCPKGDGCCP